MNLNLKSQQKLKLIKKTLQKLILLYLMGWRGVRDLMHAYVKCFSFSDKNVSYFSTIFLNLSIKTVILKAYV